MGDIVTLYEITPQEEIFVQYYLLTGNVIESAYHSHMLDMKVYKKLDEIIPKDLKLLSAAGMRALKKDKVRERISELAREHAEKNACANLTEIMAYLTAIIRKSKENEYKNNYLVNSAIKACETLIKRYPDFENSGDKKDEITFTRGEAK